MKPVKNRHFCEDCGKRKILFETEKKANNFIKFNGAEFEDDPGHKPQRSYYCVACGGWHITSMEEYLRIFTPTEWIVQAYKQEQHIEGLKRLDRMEIEAMEMMDEGDELFNVPSYKS
ncbi:MAG: hypothetical protein FWG85_01405 [Bacteroidetes bacterium]|nr:hypothetical protein [Bacteroidota bacterium]